MNQSLVIRSLIPDSRLTQISLVVAGLIMVMGMAMGNTIAAAMLAGMAAMGLGWSVNHYMNWESSALVPGFRQAHARAAIQLALCMWAILILPNLGQEGFLVARIGLCLLLVGVGLCVGLGEKFAKASTVLIVVLVSSGLVYLVARAWAKTMPAFLTSLPAFVFDLAGFVMLAGGGLLLWRFWRLATRPTEVVSAIRHADFASAIESKDHSVPAFVKKGLRPVAVPSAHNASQWLRIRRLTKPYAKCTLMRCLNLVIVIAGGLALLIAARGNYTITMIMHLYAIIMLMAGPAVIFVYAVPQSFERIWIAGIDSREQTARKLLQQAAGDSFVLFFLTLMILVIQSPYTWVNVSTTATLLFIAIGIGALFLWVAAWRYHFLINHSTGALLILACLTTAVSGVFFSIGLLEVMSDTDAGVFRLVTNVGIVPCLAVTALFAALMWTFSLHNGARAIANEPALME